MYNRNIESIQNGMENKATLMDDSSVNFAICIFLGRTQVPRQALRIQVAALTRNPGANSFASLPLAKTFRKAFRQATWRRRSTVARGAMVKVFVKVLERCSQRDYHEGRLIKPRVNNK